MLGNDFKDKAVFSAWNDYLTLGQELKSILNIKGKGEYIVIAAGDFPEEDDAPLDDEELEKFYIFKLADQYSPKSLADSIAEWACKLGNPEESPEESYITFYSLDDSDEQAVIEIDELGLDYEEDESKKGQRSKKKKKKYIRSTLEKVLGITSDRKAAKAQLSLPFMDLK